MLLSSDIWPGPYFWGIVSFVYPLMVVEIVTHLPHCLCVRCLTLDWDTSETCCLVVLDIVGFEEILVFIIDLHEFMPDDALIVLTLHRPLMHLV